MLGNATINNNMKINFKKLNKNAVIPRKATQGSVCYDMVFTSMCHDNYGNIVYGTGLAVEIPEGYGGFLFPRSSVRKTQLDMRNCIGVIDSDYRGEVMATFGRWQSYFSTFRSDFPSEYEVGDRGCQLCIIKTEDVEWVEVDELTDTERGEGGHGSTGTK